MQKSLRRSLKEEEMEVRQFMDLSGLGEEESIHYLTMSNFDLMRATELFFSQSQQSSAMSSSVVSSVVSSKQELYDEEGFRVVPDSVKRQRLIDPPSNQNHAQSVRRYPSTHHAVFGMSGNADVKTDKEKRLANMYKIPRDIMCFEDFQTVILQKD